MFKNKKMSIISIVAVFIFILSTVVTVPAATLDVTRVKQAKTKWCWAAVSEMIGHYMNSGTGKSQWDVVGYIKGMNYPNESGSNDEIDKGIRYASDNVVTYTHGSALSWSSHISNISSGNPVAVRMNWDSGGAHALVCAGTKTSGGSNYLYLIDPWENNSSQWYRYDCLKNGTTIESGTGSYAYSFWKR